MEFFANPYVVYLILVLQRIHEVILGKKAMRHHSLFLGSATERRMIVIFHTLWFAAIAAEWLGWGRHRDPFFGPIGQMIILVILAVSQIIRYWTIRLLGKSWTPFPAWQKNQSIITQGPYRWIRHPNYLVVAIEVLVVPMFFQAWISAAIFSFVHIFLMFNRIKEEETLLENLDAYREYKKMVRLNRLWKNLALSLAALCSLVMPFGMAGAAEMKELVLDYKTYEAAKSAQTYFKFIGRSVKIGLFGSNFDGYVRSGKLTYTREMEKIRDVKFEIDAGTIDTDNGSRNEKMWTKCLRAETYPKILVSSKELFDLSKDTQNLSAEMIVGGVNVPLNLQVVRQQSESSEGSSLWRGTSSFKLSEAKIPDPSIAIANVKDEFKLEFQIEFTGEK